MSELFIPFFLLGSSTHCFYSRLNLLSELCFSAIFSHFYQISAAVATTVISKIPLLDHLRFWFYFIFSFAIFSSCLTILVEFLFYNIILMIFCFAIAFSDINNLSSRELNWKRQCVLIQRQQCVCAVSTKEEKYHSFFGWRSCWLRNLSKHRLLELMRRPKW